ncbi:MAG: hypothetical protein J6D29_06105 [Solobacterium sp.]|nr:hypothetical protein [Solobacterium sp.]
MNLYPYNYYLLYGALILLVVFLVLTLLRLRPLLEALKQMNVRVEGINKETTLLNEKMEQLPKPDPDKKPSPIGAKDIFGGLMVLKAILKDKKKSGQKGMTQFRNSTSRVLNKRMQQKNITDILKKILKPS